VNRYQRKGRNQEEVVSSSNNANEARYVKPGWFTKYVFNNFVQALTSIGISVWGSRTLYVRGRVSGELRSNPVNLLAVDDQNYLVAPRGETQWVKNLRFQKNGELRVGRKVQSFDATELSDAEKTEILRAYLKRWKAEVGIFFDGVSANSPQNDLERIAPNHPVFRLTFN
jgi:deazaflavin-dependent oxidoreductase (nitroreductase family)